MKKEKNVTTTRLEKMNALIRSIEYFQVAVVNQINNQFMEVKSKVSEEFIKVVEELSNE
jgi:hypothetical protein